jgi:ubiquinone/menaquinone biosynthesis C-methylase UbiE
MCNTYAKKIEAKRTANVFDEMGVYWAEIADNDQTQRQIQFLKSYLKPTGYVLDLACGSGRHSIALNSNGYKMVGLDASLSLLKIAKKRSKDIAVVLGDIRFLPFKKSTFEAVVSVDTSFGYLSSEEEDKVSLSEVRKVMLREGLIIIDVFNREYLESKYREQSNSTKERNYPSFILQQKRNISENGDFLCDLWTIHDRQNRQVMFFEHKVRLYGRDQLGSLLNDTGFRVARVLGSYGAEDFSVVSPRLIFLAVAK